MKFVKQHSLRVFLSALLRNNCDLLSHFARGVEVSLLYCTFNCSTICFDFGKRKHRLHSRAVITIWRRSHRSAVPHLIRTNSHTRHPNTSRIDFLQFLRNHALLPMYAGKERFDQVIFLSDSFFCASDIIRLLRHSDADIKCGLDFDGAPEPKFRDTWVAHDLSGKMFFKEYPYTDHQPSIDSMEKVYPFQVTCCWNGLTILRADAFIDHNLRFRRSLRNSECHGAETELICHDYRALGLGKILVDPGVTVAYSRKEYHALSVAIRSPKRYSRQGTNLTLESSDSVATILTWETPSNCLECAPLEGHAGDHPDRKNTYLVNLYNHYKNNGVPVASSASHATVHECHGLSADSCMKW